MRTNSSIYGAILTSLLLLFPSASAASGQAVGGASYHACSDVVDTGVSIGCADATISATLTADSCRFENFDSQDQENTNFVCRVDFVSALSVEGVLICAYLTTYGLTDDILECAIGTPAEGSSQGSRDYELIPRTGKVVHEKAILCVDYATPGENCYPFQVAVSLPGWPAGMATLAPTQLLGGIGSFVPTVDDMDGVARNLEETIDAGSPVGAGISTLN